MRRAAKRDECESAIVTALREAGATVTPISQDGVFDLLVGWHGKFALLECKSTKGHLEKKQKEFLKIHTGCPLFVVRSPAEALGCLGEL